MPLLMNKPPQSKLPFDIETQFILHYSSCDIFKARLVSYTLFGFWMKNNAFCIFSFLFLGRITLEPMVKQNWCKFRGLCPLPAKYECCSFSPFPFVYQRSINFRMNLWRHHFSQNMNKKFSGFLPCVVREEISTIFCLYFGRNGDFINSFWN